MASERTGRRNADEAATGSNGDGATELLLEGLIGGERRGCRVFRTGDGGTWIWIGPPGEGPEVNGADGEARPSARLVLLRRCGLELDPLERAVYVRGEPVDLPDLQFALLWFLARNARHPQAYQTIIEQCWPDASKWPTTGSVQSLMSRLRAALGVPGAGEVIQTRAGFGYVVMPD